MSDDPHSFLQYAWGVTGGHAGNCDHGRSAGDALSWDGHTLTTLHGPAWRLLIIGAGQIANYLAQMA